MGSGASPAHASRQGGPSAQRASAGKEARDAKVWEKRISVNDAKLGDNCYYCTAAALLGLTVEKLFKKVEEMQIAAGNATAEEIASLFKTAGVGPGTHGTYGGLLGLMAAIGAAKPPAAGGLAFRRANGPGHMIVVFFEAPFKTHFIDFQTSPPTISSSAPAGVQYLLYPAPAANLQFLKAAVEHAKPGDIT